MPSFTQVMKFLRRVGLLLLYGAALVFSIAVMMAVYQSARGLTASDIEPVEKTLRQVETRLQAEAGADGVLSKFKNVNQKLQVGLETLRGQMGADDQQRRKVISDIDDVVLNLAVIQSHLSVERDANNAAVTDARTRLEALRKQIEPTATAQKVLGAALTQFGKLLTALAWPLVALIAFWFLFTSRRAPGRVAELFSPFKSVELFSAKFEIGDKIRASANETFEKFRKEAKEAYSLWVDRKSLEGKIKSLLDKEAAVMTKINEMRLSLSPPAEDLQDYRCTIHVPDLLFAETFYQLLDYVPRQPGPETRGRTWSYRFGFIGRVWRSEKSQIQGEVSTNITELTSEWGMTKEEADNAGKDRQSFLGVLLKHNSVPVGLFYMDAKGKNEFGTDADESLRNLIESECGRLEITKDLASINEELRGRAPLIRIYSQR